MKIRAEQINIFNVSCSSSGKPDKDHKNKPPCGYVRAGAFICRHIVIKCTY